MSKAVDSRRATFASLGCIVEETDPEGIENGDEVFRTLRAWNYETTSDEEHAKHKHKDKLKDTVIWNIEAGHKLTGHQIGAGPDHSLQLSLAVWASPSGLVWCDNHVPGR